MQFLRIGDRIINPARIAHIWDGIDDSYRDGVKGTIPALFIELSGRAEPARLVGEQREALLSWLKSNTLDLSKDVLAPSREAAYLKYLERGGALGRASWQRLGECLELVYEELEATDPQDFRGAKLGAQAAYLEDHLLLH